MKHKIASLGLLLAVAAGISLMTALGGAPSAPLVPESGNQSERDVAEGQSDTKAINANARPAATAPSENNVQQFAPVQRDKKTAQTRKVTIDNKEYPLRTYKPLVVPNDPSASQWWVSNSRLDQAWDIPAGSTATTLAIIDSGFALEHEEFSGRWQENAAEKGVASQEGSSALNCTARSLALSADCNLIDDNNDGIVDNESGSTTYQNPSRLNCTAQSKPLDKSCNQLDDDANSYIDDYRGWDFINYDNAPQAGELNPTGQGTTHGTRVAGIAAATGNNGKGIAGVNWNTKILPIQALDDDSYGDTLSVGRSIYYAIKQGVDVISISLGSELPDEYVREAVQDALAAGIVVVAASGNDGCDCMLYPANYPEVVAVGALASNNQPASFSSYGPNLDILAPGTGMTSTNWLADDGTAAYVSGISGTSFAAPFVGGMLTRLKSQQPTATPAQLTAALLENVNRLGLAASTSSDPRYGFGSVDGYKATSRMANPKTGQVAYAFTPVSKGNKLIPAQPVEPVSGALVYACDNGIVGASAMYELKKGESHFFSISKVENQQAINAGYTSTYVTSACVQQPHDTNSVMHSLNIFRELRNIQTKVP